MCGGSGEVWEEVNLMQSSNNLFPFGWWGFGLQGYRRCNSTYCWFPYESLPPLPYKLFQEDFNWLPILEPYVASRMKQYWLPDEDQGLIVENVEKLAASAQAQDIALPQAFVKFISDLELQKYIPSCTACYFELSDQLIPCPVNKDNFVIRFLNDQQGVFTWYLYLIPNDEHRIIVSRSYFDQLAINSQYFTNEDYREVIQDTFICANSFEEFLYRFWLENCIWFALIDKHRRLTDTEQAYLEYYLAPKQKSD
jgi:hypothetical protein